MLNTFRNKVDPKINIQDSLGISIFENVRPSSNYELKCSFTKSITSLDNIFNYSAWLYCDKYSLSKLIGDKAPNYVEFFSNIEWIIYKIFKILNISLIIFFLKSELCLKYFLFFST